MPTISIETNKIDTNRFELVQVESIGHWNKGETVHEIDAPDRMIAAMTNLGLACKWFADRKQDEHRIIAIQKDEANPDELTGSEHNDLYKVINSLWYASRTDYTEYRQNRLKYQAMYGDYVKYLDKILLYINQWGIRIQLTDCKELS